MPIPSWLPEDQATTQDQPSAEWTKVLASQAHHVLAQVGGIAGVPQQTLTHLERVASLRDLPTHAVSHTRLTWPHGEWDPCPWDFPATQPQC